MLGHPPHGAGKEQVRVVLEDAVEATLHLVFVRRERQVELPLFLGQFDILEAVPVLLGRYTMNEQYKHRLEHRRAAGIVLEAQLLNQQNEWIFLVIESVEDDLLYLRQKVKKRWIARQVRVQGERVYEIAVHRRELVLCPSNHRAPDDDIVLCRETVK